MSLLVFSRPH